MIDVLERITELREARGWTNYRLAKNAGIPQSSLLTWYGKKITPSVEALEKMCMAFDITLSEFFEENHEIVETSLATTRKQTGISQEYLAEKSGVSLQDIIAYENGRKDIRKAPYYKVEQLASVLGCPMEDIT